MISVIIPCYNCASFVKRAVQSVLNQSYQDYELLLVDNRSTDGTIHILKHYQEQFPEKVRVLHQNKRGAPSARNKGLWEARGDWIQFLDADDELHPRKLASQVRLTSDSQAGIVIGNYVICAVRGGKNMRINRYAVNDSWKGLITSNLGITSSNLWRKKDLTAVNGWDEALTSSQEYDLLFRMLKNGSEPVFDPSFLTTVHRMANSISKSTNKRKLIEIIQNRINLRYRVKNYLSNTRQLSKELNTMIDIYIYFELKRHSTDVPEYAKASIRQNMLAVPFDFMLKTNARLKLRQLFPFLRF